MAKQCWEEHVMSPTNSSFQSLFSRTCIPEEGYCYTAIIKARSMVLYQFGCWPSQATVSGLGWYGDPECLREVNRLVCLCHNTLCNNVLPSWPSNPTPSWEISPHIIFFSISLLMLISVITLASIKIRNWYLSSFLQGRKINSCENEVNNVTFVDKECQTDPI